MNFFIYGWMDRWVHYYFITMFAFDENCSIFIILYLVVWNLNIAVFLGLIVRGSINMLLCHQLRIGIPELNCLFVH